MIDTIQHQHGRTSRQKQENAIVHLKHIMFGSWLASHPELLTSFRCKFVPTAANPYVCVQLLCCNMGFGGVGWSGGDDVDVDLHRHLMQCCNMGLLSMIILAGNSCLLLWD